MKENIFLFSPNLIGYCRLLLNLVSWWFMPSSPLYAGVAYVTAGAMDAIDGHAARALNQGTRFGAMLDQLTDRMAILALTMVLCIFYPAWAFVFQLAIVVDIAGHWLHQHVCALTGDVSHKSIGKDGNPVLKIYYGSKVVLFSMVAGSELFYVSLYLYHFSTGPLVAGVGLWKLLCVASFPVAAGKTAVSAVHLYTAARRLGRVDEEERRRKQ